MPCAYVVADNDNGFCAHLSGETSLSDDIAKPDDLCVPVAAAWLKADRYDPDIALLSFKIAKGLVRATFLKATAFLFQRCPRTVDRRRAPRGCTGYHLMRLSLIAFLLQLTRPAWHKPVLTFRGADHAKWYAHAR